jgi:hypothetical protein
LFLARTHAKLGHFVRAREAYLKVIKEQLAANAPQAFREAQTAAADEIKSVEPHIASLVVKVNGADEAKGLTLTIDNEPISALLVGAPQPIDPGTHQVSVSAPGFKTTAISVTMKDAERQSVALALEPDPNAAAGAGAAPSSPPASSAPAAATAPTPAPSSPSHAGSGARTAGLVIGGIGAAALIGGTVTGIMGLSKKGSLNDQCPGQVCSYSSPEQQSRFESDKSSLKTLGTATTVLLIGGGALAATGVTLFFVGAPSSSDRVSVVSQFGPFGASLAAQGAF